MTFIPTFNLYGNRELARAIPHKSWEELYKLARDYEPWKGARFNTYSGKDYDKFDLMAAYDDAVSDNMQMFDFIMIWLKIVTTKDLLLKKKLQFSKEEYEKIEDFYQTWLPHYE